MYLTSLPLVSVRRHGRESRDKISPRVQTQFSKCTTYVAINAFNKSIWKYRGWVLSFLIKTALNSSLCAVTADSKPKWPHGKKSVFPRCPYIRMGSDRVLVEWFSCGFGKRFVNWVVRLPSTFWLPWVPEVFSLSESWGLFPGPRPPAISAPALRERENLWNPGYILTSVWESFCISQPSPNHLFQMLKKAREIKDMESTVSK